MLDVLLVRIQPTDLFNERPPNDFKFFPNEKPRAFDIAVSNGGSLQFTVAKAYYLGSEAFVKKDNAITKELGVKYGGHVVAIDKYPNGQFLNGAEVSGNQEYKFSRYEVECRSTPDYHAIILLIPGLELIVLSTLNFACHRPKGYTSSFIAFEKENVLSVKSMLGEVKGIALENCNEHALEPDHKALCYTMSFEKVSLPAVILPKLLETKPQSEGEPHEETNE
ncbi:MAG: hypothetical protein OXI43_12600 [Candidatus Poribacteria bacterium]|nr:hypothetical protein [Candidatus Poribacteria bacterium]